MRIYLDSNVFIAFFKKELGWNYKGLFVEAEYFFEKVVEKNYILCLSNYFFFEINKIIFADKKFVLNTLSELNINIELIYYQNASTKIDFESLRIHKTDELHLKTALENRCDCLVTFNTKDFLPAKKLIKVLKPDDLD